MLFLKIKSQAFKLILIIIASIRSIVEWLRWVMNIYTEALMVVLCSSMDTASGSIRGSEPTSPTSPASPTSPHSLANPLALSQALYSLHQITQKSKWK